MTGPAIANTGQSGRLLVILTRIYHLSTTASLIAVWIKAFCQQLLSMLAAVLVGFCIPCCLSSNKLYHQQAKMIGSCQMMTV